MRRIHRGIEERSRKGFMHNLLGLYVVSDVALYQRDISQVAYCTRSIERTSSFTPRLRNLAPAKYRDLRAMIVTYTVLPKIDTSARQFKV
jgi:hypothetical protein